MPAEKLEQEINMSFERLGKSKPKNNRDELPRVSNYKRVAILKVILEYVGKEAFLAKLNEVAVTDRKCNNQLLPTRREKKHRSTSISLLK